MSTAANSKPVALPETHPVREAKFPGIRSTVDGSAAVVWVESSIAQAACAYPITPSTPMGDGFAMEEQELSGFL